jgi:putative addiction module component (TIGR02574 family)
MGTRRAKQDFKLHFPCGAMIIEDMKAALDTLEELSVPERILLVEDLWDSIAKDSDAMPIADWQKKELDRRKAAFLKNPESAMPWDAVKLSVLGS